MIDYLRNLMLRDFWLKLFSLALAVLIWLTISFALRNPDGQNVLSSNATTQTYYNIPVLVMSAAPEVRSFKVDPGFVAVTVQGEKKALKNLQSREIRALVDLTGIEEAARGLRKRIEVTTPAGITFVQVVPNEVEVIVPPLR